MKQKIYLVINEEKSNVEYDNSLEKFDKDEVNKIVSESKKKEVFILVKSGCVDEILSFAQEQKYNIINKGKTYILNKCFQDTGYTLYGENIAHEAINKFKADDDNRYFFLCDDGEIGTESIECVEYINSQNRNFFINKCELISYSKHEQGNKARYCITQRVEKISLVKKEDEASIKYKNVPIRKIFEENAFSKKTGFINGVQSDEKYYPCVTFKAKGKCEKPKIIGGITFQIGDEGLENISKSSMRQFVMEGTKLFDAIKALVDNSNLVEDSPLDFNIIAPEENSILNIIGKRERETYLSSLIAYMFQCSPEIVNAFIGHNNNIGDYYVYREEKNVDILIRREDKIIVIENKINAFINETEKKSWHELIDKKERNEDLIREIDESYSDNDRKPSQLQKYYKLACYYARKQKLKDTDVICYLLCPEYKKSYYDKAKEKYTAGDKYIIKSYKDLDNIITDDNLKGLSEFKKEIIHDIKRSIKGFTQDQNTYYMDMVCGRFARRVKALSNQNEKTI